MAVKIRLKRLGKKKQPFYRIVVMDSRVPRDGKALEEIGLYQPWLKQKQTRLDLVKYEGWIGKGAQPTDTVRKIYLKQKKTAKEA